MIASARLLLGLASVGLHWRPAAAPALRPRTARWNCFARIYCVNLDDRPERWRFMEEQFEESIFKSIPLLPIQI